MKSERRGQTLRTTMLIAIVLLLAGGWWWQSRPAPSSSARAAPAVPVHVTTVQRQDVAHHGTGVGRVQALQRVVVRPQIDGQLLEIHVREGQQVRRGDLLASLDDRAIRAALTLAEAEKARAEAQLRSARLELTRFLDLSRQRAIAQQQLEQQESRVDELAAMVQAMEAAIAAEKVRLSHTRITSPIEGRVGLHAIDAGNIVTTGDEQGLFTVTRSDRVTVLFSVAQRHLTSLLALLDETGEVPVEVLEPHGVTAMATGRLVVVDPEVDSDTGNLRLRAEFDNAASHLWPGQLVSIRVQTGLSRAALTVPANAVRLGLERPFVYRVHDGKAEMVPVNRLAEEEGLSLIEGVSEGDVIVIDGFSRLTAGASVTILAGQPPASTTPAPGKDATGGVSP